MFICVALVHRKEKELGYSGSSYLSNNKNVKANTLFSFKLVYVPYNTDILEKGIGIFKVEIWTIIPFFDYWILALDQKLFSVK